MNHRLDFQRPFVDLLDRVVIFAGEDAPAYARVRARIDEIRGWFADRTDWVVVCTRELARLVKTPAIPGVGQGFGWVQQPLDYELFAWLLWYAESAGAEAFLLSQVVTEIEARAREQIGPDHLDWDNYAHRLSINRALKGLESMGALRRVDGSTEEWIADRSGDTLYEFSPLVRHLYLDPALFDEVSPANGAAMEASTPAAVDTGAGPARDDGPRQRLYRTLLLSPALYRAADPEAFDILTSRERRQRIGADLRETLGWDLEVTESYACLLRPSATETSMQYLFPARGARNHVALLLFGELQALVASGVLETDAYDRIRIGHSRLVAVLSSLRERHGERWGKTVGRLAARALTDEVLGLLRAWEVVEGPDEDGQILIMPLAARFRGLYEGSDAT